MSHSRGSQQKYFHNAIKERRGKNRIFSIIDSQGVTRRDPDKIAQAFIEFYKKLLGGKMRTGNMCVVN